MQMRLQSSQIDSPMEHRRKKIRAILEKRICLDCSTILSIYNESVRCWQHDFVKSWNTPFTGQERDNT